MKKEFYSLQELSELLGVTRRSLYTWLKAGKIKAVKIGREYRVSAAEYKRISNGGV